MVLEPFQYFWSLKKFYLTIIGTTWTYCFLSMLIFSLKCDCVERLFARFTSIFVVQAFLFFLTFVIRGLKSKEIVGPCVWKNKQSSKYKPCLNTSNHVFLGVQYATRPSSLIIRDLLSLKLESMKLIVKL